MCWWFLFPMALDSSDHGRWWEWELLGHLRTFRGLDKKQAQEDVTCTQWLLLFLADLGAGDAPGPLQLLKIQAWLGAVVAVGCSPFLCLIPVQPRSSPIRCPLSAQEQGQEGGTNHSCCCPKPSPALHAATPLSSLLEQGRNYPRAAQRLLEWARSSCEAPAVPRSPRDGNSGRQGPPSCTGSLSVSSQLLLCQPGCPSCTSLPCFSMVWAQFLLSRLSGIPGCSAVCWHVFQVKPKHHVPNEAAQLEGSSGVVWIKVVGAESWGREGGRDAVRGLQGDTATPVVLAPYIIPHLSKVLDLHTLQHFLCVDHLLTSTWISCHWHLSVECTKTIGA